MFAVTMTANSNLVNKLNSEKINKIKNKAFGEGKEYTSLNVLSVRKSRSAVENLPGRASKDTGRSKEIRKPSLHRLCRHPSFSPLDGVCIFHTYSSGSHFQNALSATAFAHFKAVRCKSNNLNTIPETHVSQSQ